MLQMITTNNRISVVLDLWITLYAYIYGSRSNAVGTSEYTSPNNVINELWIGNNLGCCSDLILDTIPLISWRKC
jgi:hypothetical protein